jgi:hypothetical protein
MAKSVKVPLPTAKSDVGNMDVNIDIGTIKEPSPQEKLKEAIGSLPPIEGLGDGVDLTAGGKIKSTTLIINEVPTLESINVGPLMEGASRTAAASALSAIPGLDVNAASVLQGLANAPAYREKPRSMHTQVMIDNRHLAIPAQVRDLPGALYLDGGNNYVRNEADQILKSLFGELASLAESWAAKRGFRRDPFVWISQALYEYMELNRKVDYKCEIVYERPYNKEGLTEIIKYTPSIPYNSAIDDDDTGLLLQTLHRCFYFGTVNHLRSRARENNLSVIEILRSWIGQYHKDFKPVESVVL